MTRSTAVAVGLLASSGCLFVGAMTTAAGSPPCADVKVWDTRGSGDEATWIPIAAPGAPIGEVVIDNGLARISRGIPTNPEQNGAHQLKLWRGGQLVNVTGGGYGDYTYWSSSVVNPPYSTAVTQVSAGAAIVEYKFKVNSAFGPIDLVKRISMRSCLPGMFVHFHSTPVNPCCEREWGVGGQASNVTFSPEALVVHPLHGRHASLGGTMMSGPGPSWSASYHMPDILATMILKRPMVTRALQFDATNLGIHVVNAFDEEPGDAFQGYVEGRDYPFEFILEAETWNGGTLFQDVTASGGAYRRLGSGWTSRRSVVTEGGVYDLWLRYRAPSAPRIDVFWPGGGSTVFAVTTVEQFVTQKVARVILAAGSSELALVSQDDPMDFDAAYLVPFGYNEMRACEIGPGLDAPCADDAFPRTLLSGGTVRLPK